MAGDYSRCPFCGGKFADDQCRICGEPWCPECRECIVFTEERSRVGRV